MPFTIATVGWCIRLAIHTRTTIAARVRLRTLHGFIHGRVTSITMPTIGAITCRTASHVVGSSNIVLAIPARTTIDARVTPSCSCARYAFIRGNFTIIPRPQGSIIANTGRRRSLIRIDTRRISSVITDVSTVPGSRCTANRIQNIIRPALAATPSSIVYITAHVCCMTVAIICHGTNIMVNLTALAGETIIANAGAVILRCSMTVARARIAMLAFITDETRIASTSRKVSLGINLRCSVTAAMVLTAMSTFRTYPTPIASTRALI